MSEKLFVGKVEAKETKFGTMTKIGLTKDDLQKLSEHLSEKGWVNLTLKNSQKGTQYLEIDTWKPTAAAPKFAGQEAGDLPF